MPREEFMSLLCRGDRLQGHRDMTVQAVGVTRHPRGQRAVFYVQFTSLFRECGWLDFPGVEVRGKIGVLSPAGDNSPAYDNP